jgi:hypothetical protein
MYFAAFVVKSSQVNTLPKAKSKTRSKQKKENAQIQQCV